MAGTHINFEISLEDFLGNITEAAYQVALRHGFNAPFIDVKLDLQQALREAICRNMKVCPFCNTTSECQIARRHVPFSREANFILNITDKD